MKEENYYCDLCGQPVAPEESAIHDIFLVDPKTGNRIDLCSCCFMTILNTVDRLKKDRIPF
jgi:hypothetical protein